jgi:branched-chain amino acid transport system permease protein
MVSQLVIGLSTGAAYALVAVGVVLIFKSTRALSIAQGEIGAFGFYIGLKGIPGWHWNVPRFFTLVIAVVVGGLVGLVVERIVMRPLVKRPPLDALIATLGVALFLALLEQKMYGINITRAPSPVGDWSVRIFGVTLIGARVTAFFITVAVAAALYLFFSRSKFGLAVLATTSDPTVARVLGVPVNQVYRFAWVAGGVLSGIAAALLAPAFGATLTPFSLTRFSLRALAGAVIGGLDSVWGAIVGSVIVGVVESVVRARVHLGGGGDPAPLAVLVLVVLTLMIRPRGLLGESAAA